MIIMEFEMYILMEIIFVCNFICVLVLNLLNCMIFFMLDLF